MKKGNAGVVVLIIALFVTIIALCGVVLYYNLEDNNSNVEQNNNENTEVKNEQSNNNISGNVNNNNNNTQQNTNTTTNNEQKKEEQTTGNNTINQNTNTNTNTNTTSTNIESLSSEDKEILRKIAPELLEDAGITGTITSQSFYQLKIKFKELAEKEDMSDAEKNQKINTFNEAVKIFEAIMLYENVGVSPVDVIWKNEISDDGRAMLRDYIEFYKLQQSAQTAVSASKLSNAKHACALAYAQGLTYGNNAGKNDGLAYTSDGELMTVEDYYKVVAEELEKSVTEIKSQYVITINEKGAPSVEVK